MTLHLTMHKQAHDVVQGFGFSRMPTTKSPVTNIADHSTAAFIWRSISTRDLIRSQPEVLLSVLFALRDMLKYLIIFFLNTPY